MEDLVNIIVQNALGAASFFFMVIYITFDKKQVEKEKEDNNKFMQDMVKALNLNTETLKAVNDNQKDMANSLEKLSYKMETLESKINEKRNNE